MRQMFSLRLFLIPILHQTTTATATNDVAGLLFLIPIIFQKSQRLVISYIQNYVTNM